MKPRLMRSLGGEAMELDEAPDMGINPRWINLVKEGMYAVVNEPGGTAFGKRLTEKGLSMAGKTGTVQVRRITREERLQGVFKNEDLPWKRRDHGWFVAYDVNFGQHSPGQLLFGQLIRDMENTPYRILDFGSGDYRFKHEFCNLERAVAHGTISGGGVSGLARNAFYGARQWAENQKNERLARLPGKAMRRLDTYRGLY